MRDGLTPPDHHPRAASASPSAASQLPPAFPSRAPWGTAQKLRAWQAEAFDQYVAHQPRDFLAVATPGAGKTTFALRVATELLSERVVGRITVVAPTEHLKTQWADAAARVGVKLDPRFRNAHGRHASGYDGVAVTYAQVAANPALHRARTQADRTLVILDEIHHGGDALSWGDAIEEAFDPATRRLGLTGTPFRSDTAAIPFVRYEVGADGIRRSSADYTYGYGNALQDGVVRPVLFLAYSGNMRWRTNAGDEVSARLGEPLTKDMTGQAWRTALDPAGEWIPAVLQAADRRLSEVRRGMPDAGGLVIATDQTNARNYAATLREVTGEEPVVVLSDDADASKGIEEFTEGNQRWLVAVRMVSEGVDVPRLAVGVYATSSSTPLFFAQAIGRFVRARRRGETASIFLPSVAPLLQLGSELELERDHALDRRLSANNPEWNPEQNLVDQAQRGQTEPDLFNEFEALDAQAEFDRVLFDGGEFGTAAEVGSVEEEEFLGIPGLLDANQVSTLLRQRQAKQVKSQRKKGRDVPDPVVPETEYTHRDVRAMRKELATLVAAWSRRTGQPHATVHTALRKRTGGVPVAEASGEDIARRINLVREWFLGRN